MKVKGINKIYDVEISKVKCEDHNEGICVTAGNMMTGMTSVVISKANWEKLKKVK